MANQCFLTAQIVLVVQKKSKTKNKKQTAQQKKKQRKNQEKINKLKKGIIVSTMNHYPKNRYEREPELSTR